MRKELEAHVRGVLKVFGICRGPAGRANLRQGFRDQLAEAGQADPALGVMADMFVPIHSSLCAAAEAMDEELRIIARQSGLACRLMTVPGVGSVVALSFIANRTVRHEWLALCIFENIDAVQQISTAWLWS